VVHVEKIGQGPALVLVHGWGLNSGVWAQVQATLAKDFTLYCIDLPGFGYSKQRIDSDIKAWAKAVAKAIEEPAVWLGWSLGGLVATQVALDYPQQVTGLVTVASSPRFSENDQWPGIKSEVMTMFTKQLATDFSLTLERFLAIQAMGSDSAKRDIKALKTVLDERPLPQQQSLHDGLLLLNDVDLREEIKNIEQPFLRIYGRLDSLVPSKAISLVDELSPKSEKVIFKKASHAPFISHTDEFISALKGFMSTIEY